MDVFCDVALHPQARVLCPQAGQLHLLWGHPGNLVISTRPAQIALGRLANPIAQAGFGYAQDLGHHGNGLTRPHLAHRLHFELLRVLRTQLLVCHLSAPCRYFQQG